MSGNPFFNPYAYLPGPTQEQLFGMDRGHITYYQGRVRVIDDSHPFFNRVGTISQRRGFRMDDDGRVVYSVIFLSDEGEEQTWGMYHDQIVPHEEERSGSRRIRRRWP